MEPVRLAKIRPVGNWSPKRWQDNPKRGIVLSVSQPIDSLSAAETACWLRNDRRLRSRKVTTWIVLLRPGYRPRFGDECVKVNSLFDAA